MSNNNKIFKNLDEQIQILIDKGLIINDVDHAKEILLKENYKLSTNKINLSADDIKSMIKKILMVL